MIIEPYTHKPTADTETFQAGGAHLKTTVPGKTEPVPDYATIQGILIGAVAAFVVCMIVIGPEYAHVAPFSVSGILTVVFHYRNLGSHFERYKTAIEEGGGRDEEVSEDSIGHMGQPKSPVSSTKGSAMAEIREV